MPWLASSRDGLTIQGKGQRAPESAAPGRAAGRSRLDHDPRRDRDAARREQRFRSGLRSASAQASAPCR
jgi:hypothetical protein